MKQKYVLYDDLGDVVEEKEIDVPDISYDVARKAALSKLDGEGMDAMRKAIESLASFLVADLPDEYLQYAGKVEEIKTKHPKPKET